MVSLLAEHDIIYSSSNAGLIFMEMPKPDENFVEYYKKLHYWIHQFPTTVLVLAAKVISFGEELLQQGVFRDDGSRN